MKKIIGVHLDIINNNGKKVLPLLKRASLFYDEIAIPNLERNLELFKEIFPKSKPIKELDHLIENNIIFDPTKLSLQALTRTKNEIAITESHLLSTSAKELEEKAMIFFKNKDYQKFKFLSHQSAELFARKNSLLLNQYNDIEAVPIVNKFTGMLPFVNQKRTSVIELIINKFPVIDNLTPWEKIIEFKKDKDAREKYIALRVLISEMVNSNLNISEIDEKLEYLITEYQKHIHLHKMKTTTSLLETVLVTSAEFIENIVRLKLSRAAKLLFKMRHKEIELLESEYKIKNREIAYIAKVDENFA